MIVAQISVTGIAEKALEARAEVLGRNPQKYLAEIAQEAVAKTLARELAALGGLVVH